MKASFYILQLVVVLLASCSEPEQEHGYNKKTDFQIPPGHNVVSGESTLEIRFNPQFKKEDSSDVSSKIAEKSRRNLLHWMECSSFD